VKSEVGTCFKQIKVFHKLHKHTLKTARVLKKTARVFEKTAVVFLKTRAVLLKSSFLWSKPPIL